MSKIDLTPAIQDLALYAGDGESFKVKFQDDADPPQPVDVSALTWASQIRKSRRDTVAYDLHVDTTDAATGIIIVVISAAITRVLPSSSQWDLQCRSDAGDPETILQGTVTCSNDVTREIDISVSDSFLSSGSDQAVLS